VQAYRVPLNLRTDDDWMEFVVVQWRVPTPEDFASIPDEWVAAKKTIIEKLAEYLRNNPPVGPRFIVFPEISVPFALRTELEDILLRDAEQPTILVAGLEHITKENHVQITTHECENLIQQQLAYTSEDDDSFYNDALIVVRSSKGIRRYVQPKCQSWVEEPRLNHCADVLVFDIGPKESPFTFCVQICSDFNNAPHVTDLRRAVKSAGIHDLDLTLLIEHNKWQFNDVAVRANLKLALREYFSAAGTEKTRTDKGLVLLANRARDTLLSTEFGGGGLVFGYDLWTPRSVLLADTYYWKEDSAYSLQHVFFRVEVPAIHRFTYRRRDVTDAEPGSSQQSPFLNSRMTTAMIAREETGSDATALGEFRRIPPFHQLLRRIWAACAVTLSNELKLAGIDHDVAKSYLDHTHSALTDLGEQCKSGLNQAITSFSSFLGSSGAHPRPNDPSCWTEAEERAIDRFARSHALISIGVVRNGFGSVEVALSNTTQGSINNDADIAYVWCDGTEETGRALVNWLHRDAGTMAASPVLVVGVESDPSFTPRRFQELRGDVTHARETDIAISPLLQPQGSVVASGLDRTCASYLPSPSLIQAAVQPGNDLDGMAKHMRPHLERCKTELKLWRKAL